MCIHGLDNDNNYTHYTVNYSINFVDPEIGVHIQKSEGICKYFLLWNT